MSKVVTNSRKLDSFDINYRSEGQLTVAELVAELQKYPPDALVWHEGCDCHGAANGVVIVEYGDILITRVK